MLAFALVRLVLNFKFIVISFSIEFFTQFLQLLRLNFFLIECIIIECRLFYGKGYRKLDFDSN